MLSVVLFLPTTSTTQAEILHKDPEKIFHASTSELVHAPDFLPLNLQTKVWRQV
jgi:hypothetical protein